MYNLGHATIILGLEIDCDEDGITLSQLAYIQTMLGYFNMHESNGLSSPIEPKVKSF